MKSTAFFQAVRPPSNRPPEDPEKEPGGQGQLRSILLALLSVLVVGTVLGIGWSQFSEQANDTTEDPIRSASEGELTNQTTSIYDLSISPQGDQVFFRTTSGQIRRMNLLDDPGDELSLNLFPERHCELFRVSPNNQYMLIAFRNNDTVLADLSSSNVAESAVTLLKLNPTEAIVNFSFSDDSHYVALGTTDGTVEVWDLVNRDRIAFMQSGKPDLTGLALGHDNQLFLCFGARLELWEIRPQSRRTLKLIRQLADEAPAREMVISRDGKYLVVGQYNGKLEAWDLESGERAWSVHTVSPASRTLVVSPDGEFVTCASIENELMIHQIATGEPVSSFYREGMGYVTGAAFSKAGDLLYTSSTDGMIRIWSVPGNSLIGRIDPEENRASN